MAITDLLADLDSRIEKAKPNLIRWLLIGGAGAVVVVGARWAWSEHKAKKIRTTWETFSSHLAVGGGNVFLRVEKADAIPAVREATGGAWADLAAVFGGVLGNYLLGESSPSPDFAAARSTLQSLSSEPAIQVNARGALAVLSSSEEDGIAGLEKKLDACDAWFASHPSLLGNSLPADSPTLSFGLAGDSDLSFRLEGTTESEQLTKLVSSLARESAEGVTWAVDLADDLWKLQVPEGEEASLQEALAGLKDSASALSLFPGTLCVLVGRGAEAKHSLAITQKDHILDFLLSSSLRPIGYVVDGLSMVAGEEDGLSRPPLEVRSIRSGS